MSLIEIIGLTKTYGRGDKLVEALRGIDLTVEEREIFGVVGLSGAGKSTLIRCLNRLETPTSGRVLVGGKDLTSLSEKELRHSRRGMGMIFQSFNLLSSRTVAANIAFPLEVSGQSRSVVKSRVAELVELVGLADKASAYPAQLSGGQKQRVGIARALANNPTILLCDEATSALDPQTTKSILALIEDVKNRLGLTVVLITHEMRVITEICDRVAVMEDGKIVELGPVVDVFTKPNHPTSKSFVEAQLSNRDYFLDSNYCPKGVLVRISFIGEKIGDPLLSSLIRQFSVEPVILQAHVDRIKKTPYGTLVIDLAGPDDRVQSALRYLETLDLNMEVMTNVSKS